MRRWIALGLLLAGCGGSFAPSPTPTSTSTSTSTQQQPPSSPPPALPSRPPPAPPAERCVTIFSSEGARLVRGTAEADVSLAEALANELVALAPGIEVEASLRDGRVAVTAPVRGFFAGTLSQRCGPPSAPLAIAFDAVAPRRVPIPEDARELHDVNIDVDSDGALDRVRVLSTDGDDYGYLDLLLSRLAAPSSFRVRLDDGIVAGCFAVVDGRPAYVQSLTRGSTAGVRVHVLRADGSWRPHAGLLGRAIAGTRDDRADLFAPPASEALWQGAVDDWLDRAPVRCPLDGRAIDVPRDAHYPIDDDPASNELAIVRLHGLSSTYEGLPVGPGPVIEVRTATSE